ncbi:MAG: DUF192 domain-containing protein [Gammaproteobacteria bacterium]|nr:DUF192 domain-containing protein [Gammaproteobacteria bacterium]
MTTKLQVAAILIFLTGLSCAGERDPALSGFFAAPLGIKTTTGTDYNFTVYLAVSPQQREHGLMFVRTLPADYGMLFINKKSRVTSMWMKNTILPLDMLFIRADGTISSIASNTVPGSLESISSEEAVMGVLELNAGTSKRLNLAPGDKVIHSAFATRSNDGVSPANGRR